MAQKNVLITGASRGIGAETARQFARAGYGVAVNYYRSEREALTLVEELQAQGCSAAAFQADVSSSAESQRLLDNVLDKFCQLDILVCNAGISLQKMLGDLTDAEWRHLFAVNVDGVFYPCRAALPHFVHRKAGKIITVSSMWGQTGGSCEVAYSATKAAVIGFTKALAKELGPSGIGVNCVAPGVIATEMNAHLDGETMAQLREETPLGRIGTAADVAASILFLAGPGGDFLTGQVLSPNGGILI
jgi:3-oxoacyl-[acyl-carrier protein] reductase